MTTAKRVPQLPDVPTVRESGYPEFEGTGWGGLIAPKGTIEPMGSKEWTEYVKQETIKWHDVAKRANVHADY